jgi:hypothetical protein
MAFQAIATPATTQTPTKESSNIRALARCLLTAGNRPPGGVCGKAPGWVPSTGVSGFGRACFTSAMTGCVGGFVCWFISITADQTHREHEADSHLVFFPIGIIAQQRIIELFLKRSQSSLLLLLNLLLNPTGLFPYLLLGCFSLGTPRRRKLAQLRILFCHSKPVLFDRTRLGSILFAHCSSGIAEFQGV